MGSFSWLKADNLTNVANIAYGHPFKMLIPKQYGGGFVEDHYQDYGLIGTKAIPNDAWNGEAQYDMYELVAMWNANAPYKNGIVMDYLKFNGDFNPMKEIDEHTNNNRTIGIHIGCGDKEIDELEFPLKLVSCSYNESYENCENRSYNDPTQGFRVLYRG